MKTKLRETILLLPLLLATAVAAAAQLPVVAREAWGARAPVGAMEAHEIRAIVVHHTAALRQPARALEEKMRALQAFSQSEAALAGTDRLKPAWPDFPYHYYVDHAGRVAEGREVRFAGDTNTDYDPRGQLQIVLEGNFEEERPTPAQLAALTTLLDETARRYGVPPERIEGHLDHADGTLCPGRHLYDLLPRLRESVRDRADEGLPPVDREFRGVWVASVANIDWPSRPGLPASEQRAELLAVLDRSVELGLNAVILQVRPAADALYPSELEPWSEYLTGEAGRAPEPFYDPLAFAVEEAHRRGLELHAWFNPFRARHPSAASPVAPGHLAATRPELVREYGTHLWLDPGEPEVRAHSVAVVLDVVRRYDVDGVHIDDYFYPYRERDSLGIEIDFPDSASYARYRAAGGELARDDWRRDNVDRFVREVYEGIKAEKRWVRFGVSPISTWRPGNPPQIRGFDAYAQIYADARKWLREGWLDYFAPQLYREIARTDLSFPILLNWWSQQNVHARHLWPGLIPSRVGNPAEGNWGPEEIVGQVYVARGHPGASGHIHFSMRNLMPPGVGPPNAARDSLTARLRREAYARPALAPASPWLGEAAPGRPAVTARIEGGAVALALEPGAGEPVWLWTVQARAADGWAAVVVPGWARTHALPAAWGVPDAVWVRAVGRTGNEGPAAEVRLGGAGAPAASR